MDRGIWATWYDLPETGREDYISWLNEVHIQEMLSRSVYLWAAHVKNDTSEARERRLHSSLTHTNDPSVPAGNN